MRSNSRIDFHGKIDVKVGRGNKPPSRGVSRAEFPGQIFLEIDLLQISLVHAHDDFVCVCDRCGVLDLESIRDPVNGGSADDRDVDMRTATHDRSPL